MRTLGPSEADALITGPTGAGKEVVAQAMHDLSPRAGKPFIAINCAALPAQLIESELFGHEAGAFPGALRARFGRFEHARGGTILLDEIGSMPLDLQARLLRVLQDRVITRLGSNDPIALDVRFLATSKADLAQAAAQGAFRQDLLYRLAVATIRVPPLADRREDIPSSSCSLSAKPPPATGSRIASRTQSFWRNSRPATGPATCANCATPPTALSWASTGWRARAPRPRAWPTASRGSNAA